MHYWLITVLVATKERSFILRTPHVMDQLSMKLFACENYVPNRSEIINIDACRLGLWEIDVFRAMDVPVYSMNEASEFFKKSA